MNFIMQIFVVFGLISINIQQINTSNVDLHNTLLDIFGKPPDEHTKHSTIPDNGLNQMILNHFGPPKLKGANEIFHRENCNMASSGWICQEGMTPDDAELKSPTNPGKETIDPAVDDQIKNLFRPIRSPPPPLIKENDFVKQETDEAQIFTEDFNNMEYKFQSPDTILDKHKSYGNEKNSTTIQPLKPEVTTLKPFEPSASPNHAFITTKDSTNVSRTPKIEVTKVELKPINMGDDTKEDPELSKKKDDTKIATTMINENLTSKPWAITEPTHSTAEDNILVTHKPILNSTTGSPDKSSCKSVKSNCLQVLLLLCAIVLF